MYRLFLVSLFFTTAILLILISATITLARQKKTNVVISHLKKDHNQLLVPTLIPSITKITPQVPTITPTFTPTPAQSVIVVSAVPANTNINYQTFIIQAINVYRESKGLSPIATNNETCAFAKVRAQEITNDFTHDGFRIRIENKSLPYASYASVTENIAMNSDYTQVVNQWIHSRGHAENMQKDTPYVCVERVGDYYVYEGWKP